MDELHAEPAGRVRDIGWCDCNRSSKTPTKLQKPLETEPVESSSSSNDDDDDDDGGGQHATGEKVTSGDKDEIKEEG